MKGKTDRRQEIVQAAKSLFSKKGYSSTSMDEIAEKVGITKASLYYFFESKERIFAEIIEEVLAEIRNYMAMELKICKEHSRPLAEMIDRTISICLKNGIVIRSVDVKMADIHPIIFEKNCRPWPRPKKICAKRWLATASPKANWPLKCW